MSHEWATLTVSSHPLLDEITAALRDAGIELRLSPAGQHRPQTGVRTRFGERAADAQLIEVPAADHNRARGLIEDVFRDAEQAAYLGSGAPLPSPSEMDEEAAWRAQRLERQRTIDRRFKRCFQLFLLLVVGGIAFAILYSAVR